MPEVYNDEDDVGVLTAATDGFCLWNGQTDAIAGAGVFVPSNHVLNWAIRLPCSMEQTNQMGEAIATLTASCIVGVGTPMIQETDSQTVNSQRMRDLLLRRMEY